MKNWKNAFFGLVVIIAFSFAFIACSNGNGIPEPGDDPDDPRPAFPELMSGKTAMQYFTSEGITVGLNLGNTLDAVNNWDYENPIAEEGCWNDNPKANQALFNGIKAQGFDIVRIPVTWTGHIGTAPNYTVSPDRLRRVAEVAGYARNAGLKAIINMHHDDAADWGGWLLLDKAAANENDCTQITAKFEKAWAQIAEYFENFGDWLVFESMNEVHDETWGWTDAFRNNPKLFIDIVNEWNQRFTNAVRSAGGNNAQRFLMYPSHHSDVYGILPDGKVGGNEYGAEIGQYFKLPTDSATGKQILTFHFYDSDEFPFEGTKLNWGTQEEKDAVDNLFSKVKTEFIDKNIPVVIGESGKSRASGINIGGSKMTPEQLATATASRLLWADYVYTKAKQNGLVPCWWDNGNFKPEHEKDQFGLFDRNTGKPNSTESKEIIDAITKR